MIEFYYFEGCPNAATTLNNLKELIKEGLISQKEFKIIEVPDLEIAEKVNFQGSPSILVNGRDIVTEKKPHQANYTCRIYNFENKNTGIIPKAYIKNKIVKMNK